MIKIQNIYYMLAYAFRVLKEQSYKSIEAEQFDNAAELLSAILIKGISVELKRGLGKEYISKSEPLSSLRGKIDISSSIKTRTIQNKQLVCDFDEFSVDSYMNRILKTTIGLLIGSDISKMRKKELRKLWIFFFDVSTLDPYSINWRLHYNRNNQTYQMLISVCYLIIKGLVHTKNKGSTKLADFIDEQRMCRLYEKFILEYYRKEFPDIKTSSSQIAWQLDDDFSEMLPIMQSDIMLLCGDKTLIIDAKYYTHTMQTNSEYDSRTMHSHNLYQIFTYVKNQDKTATGNVSGMLLYAKTDEKITPDHKYLMSGNQISVKTLDLNCDFSEISKQLDDIACCYFTQTPKRR